MAAADDAARRAGVTVTLAHSHETVRLATGLWATVWPKPCGDPPVAPEIATALAHSGNYVAVARRGNEVVGAALGFRGVDDEGPLVHSHIAGVLPGGQGRGVGAALKLHQREWALENRIDRIAWTFDPLVARNAFFNLNKLGGELVAYYVDFYGQLEDGINGGDQTDRGLLMWRLESPRAVAASGGTLPEVDIAERRRAGSPVVLEPDESGWPVARSLPATAEALIHVPADIVALRQREPALASAWRKTLRDVLVDALAQGWLVTDATRDAWYVLTNS